VQNVEFFHKVHFENCYHRKKAKKSLAGFIDFFRENDFDEFLENIRKDFQMPSPKCRIYLSINLGYSKQDFFEYSYQKGANIMGNKKVCTKTFMSENYMPRKGVICAWDNGN
jgi:hypothetical protein